MLHPLDGAYVRLDRAEKHFSELKEVVSGFIDSEIELALNTIQLDPEPRVMLEFGLPHSAIPTLIPVLIGEIAYNLRAALDYLIYQLAIRDSGCVQKRTQFPLEDSPSQFQGRSKTILNGVNAAHAAEIERLQPYNGANWARLLRTISNPDKHCDLVVRQRQHAVSVLASPNSADVPRRVAIAGAPRSVLYVRFKIESPDGNVYMKFEMAYSITFDDGLPVIETLEEIKAQVTNTLANFKPEFEA